jgi:prophage regulatory protein
LPATPLETAPRPAQAFAVILPQPPQQEKLGDPVAALLYLADLPPDKLLTVEQVLKLIPISISTWRRGVRSGRFPPGVRLSARSVFRRVDAIRALLQTP